MKSPQAAFVEKSVTPQALVVALEKQNMTVEEAVFSAARVYYGGGTIKGRIKARFFQEFWECRISGETFKAQILANAKEDIRPIISAQIQEEARVIYDDTVKIAQRVFQQSARLWSLIQDSDIFWLLPVNVYNNLRESVDSDQGGADWHARQYNGPNPLTGQLRWPSKAVNYE